MRLIFLGSGEFGLPTLSRLREAHDIVAVVSQPDRPAGRRRQLTPTPIAAWAAAAGLNVLRSDDVNAPAMVERIRSLRPAGAVVIAFGQKLSPMLVAALGDPVVNLHASLLPKFRGAAPINWAIIHGERETGLSVIGLAPKMDAGPIYAQRATPIDPGETAGELHHRLAALGPELVLRVLAERPTPRPQDESRATLAPKLTKAQGTVDFRQPAVKVRCLVHGLTPWPGATVLWKRLGNLSPPVSLILRRVASEPCDIRAEPGTVLEGQRVATLDGAVKLLEVQLPGGKPMAMEDFARGHALRVGDVLRPVQGPA